MPQTATKANVGALVPAVIVLVSYIVGRWTGTIALPSDAELSGAIIAIITAAVSYGMGWLAIYLPANKPVDSAGNRMRSHPIATLTSIGITLALLGTFLAGCAAPAGGVREDVSGHIATAERYVSVAVVAADACVAAQVPFCVEHASDIGQAKAVAAEALSEAKAIAAADPTQAQTLLRVAMNAVLLFYSLKG
jgi:hypothetical protein